jgi:hypothetical protein
MAREVEKVAEEPAGHGVIQSRIPGACPLGIGTRRIALPAFRMGAICRSKSDMLFFSRKRSLQEER